MAPQSGLSEAARRVLAATAEQLPAAPLLVALGGGADSAVCAWAAITLGRTVRTATVDHGLPGSPVVVEAARRTAAALGVEHRLLPGATSDPSEESLRVVRYRALEAEAGEGELIVTGHTRDDQAETVLGNLARGAGTPGLAGIPVRRGRWVRPLLGVGRAEARQAADDLGLPYADDPANEDPGRRRNRLRHRVLPLLEEAAGPGVRAALARAADLLAADDAILEREAQAVPMRRDGGSVRLAAAALSTLPAAVAGRAARRGLRVLLAPYPGFGEDIRAVLRVAAGEAHCLAVQGGHLAYREGPWVVLRPAALPTPAPPVVLPVPGTAACGRWLVTAAGPFPRQGPMPVGRRQAWADPGLAAQALSVRTARPGDRIDTGRGAKPVAEALREAGVPSSARGEWPVVLAGGTIAWVAGARLAAWAAPRGPEAIALRLREG